MNIGIDFYDTITNDPSKFRRLIRRLKEKGHTVFVVSAVKEENVGRLERDFKKSRMRCELVPVVFNTFFDVPMLKVHFTYFADERLQRGIAVDYVRGHFATFPLSTLARCALRVSISRRK